ncbi:MAG: 3-methylitaconate isomerase [Actinomycetota bacterium]|nr:MAG: 3-methylitaconate isomerase [Actinomycetota bacterium]
MHRKHSGGMKMTPLTAAGSELVSKQGELISVDCSIIRGGSSKGVFLARAALPDDQRELETFLLALMGSPDPRQVDGLGGADLLTSKVAMIGPPSVDGADLDYTFAQVSVTHAKVNMDMNCGNISAAVGIYAIEHGYVKPVSPFTTVRVHNTNTHKIFIATVPVLAGVPAVEGTCKVDGVPGTGAEIVLDYKETIGSVTGKLLPTGSALDEIDVPLIGTISVSIIDIANLCVLVRASDAGFGPGDIPCSPSDVQIAKADSLQRAVARMLGIPEGGLVPIPVLLDSTHNYPTVVGDQNVSSDDIDFVAEVIGGQPLVLHKAFPGTASVTVAVAARLPGTIAYELGQAATDQVRIGHPTGRNVVTAQVSIDETGNPVVEKAAYTRTARKLMEGKAFLRASQVLDRGI